MLHKRWRTKAATGVKHHGSTNNKPEDWINNQATKVSHSDEPRVEIELKRSAAKNRSTRQEKQHSARETGLELDDINGEVDQVDAEYKVQEGHEMLATVALDSAECGISQGDRKQLGEVSDWLVAAWEER